MLNENNPNNIHHTIRDAVDQKGPGLYDFMIKILEVESQSYLKKMNKLSEGNRVAFADAEDPGFWSKLRFGKLKVIVLALPEFHAQNWSTLQARRYGFIGKIIVPTRSNENTKILENSGADEIYDAYEAVGIGVTNIINEMQKNN